MLFQDDDRGEVGSDGECEFYSFLFPSLLFYVVVDSEDGRLKLHRSFPLRSNNKHISKTPEFDEANGRRGGVVEE